MSKIAIKGATTGTGVFTLESPATNTDRTLILPDEAGTVLTSASDVAQKGVPAFSAYQSSAQTLSSATFTKIQLQAEEFDTANCFDSTTNYRFTPTVAGYYMITGSLAVSSFVTQIILSIYKNGVLLKEGFNNTGSGHPNMTALIYLNGTTDYVELYAWLSGGQALSAGSAYTYFQGVLVRAA